MRHMRICVALCGLFLMAAVSAHAEVLRGDTVPDAALVTVDGDATTLHEALDGTPSIIVFYRGAWCPFCIRHLAALGAVKDDLVAMGYQVIAISPDRPAELKRAAEKSEQSYIYLSDSSMEAAKAFDLEFVVDPDTRERYKGYGIDLEAASGESHHMLPKPAAYVVDAAGRVAYRYVNEDYKVRAEPRTILAAAAEAVGHVLRHAVLIRFKDGTPPETIEAIEQAMAAFPGSIPEILALEWGADVSDGARTKGYTHMALISFLNQADLDAYLAHEAHQAFLEQAMPHVDELLVLDYVPGQGFAR